MMEYTVSHSSVTLIYRNIRKREKEKGEKEGKESYFTEQG
jgi:hypothetical protein